VPEGTRGLPISPDDAAYCEREVRAHDPDRWLTALFAPDAARPRLHALLAFGVELSRTVDAASQPMLGEIRLQWWREALEGVFAGSPRAHPVARALAPSVTAEMRPLLDGMIEARAADLYETPPADIAALEAYADAVHGALSEAVLLALGLSAPDVLARARRVGTAWGLGDLLKRLSAMLARRRLPLPADWLAEAGTDPDRVLAGLDADAVRLASDRLAVVALRRLAEARAGARMPRAAYPALLLARLASRDLARWRRQGAAPVLPVAMPWRQLSLLIGALVRRW